MKSVALGVISFSLFLCLPGTFAWSAKGVGNVKWKQNEVLYKLESIAGFEQTNLIGSELDADIDEEIAEIEFDTIRRLHSRSKSTEELMQRLMRNPHVLYAEPNYIITIDKTPNDPLYGSDWGMPKISAPLAWDVTIGTGDVVVGVVDYGVDYNHPDLAANIWSNPGVINGCPSGTHGFNTVNNNCDPMEVVGHGTLVSGIIGAIGNNGTGIAGVNWNTKIMGLKFIDSNGNADVARAIAAIDWAVTAKQAGVNLRVLNISWGYEGAPSQAFLDEINKAASWDILIVASAGNNSWDTDVTPHYPASYVASNEIAVAATTSTDDLAWFSSYGVNSVHLGAPGEDIYSTYLNNTYFASSGTSFAAPHVSGAAALILSACSQLTVNELKALILNNVDPLPSLTGKVSTGGRLNVYKAIQNCSGGLARVWLEGESGSLTAPMAIGSDSQASSGAYVWIPEGTGNVLDNPLLAVGSVAYTFSVPVAGNYVVWGRLIDNLGNSFFVSMDSGSYALWDTVGGSTWGWDRVNNRGVADPVVYSLGVGQHTLVIKHREDGAKLDRILVTNDMAYVPQGQGEVVP